MNHEMIRHSFIWITCRNWTSIFSENKRENSYIKKDTILYLKRYNIKYMMDNKKREKFIYNK